PPYLHSFPTRRSSDLHEVHSWRESRVAITNPNVCRGLRSTCARLEPQQSYPCLRFGINNMLLSSHCVDHRRYRLIVVISRVWVVDRKSTRLNSSHLVI